MADIVEALQVALPLGLSEERFAAPENRQILGETLGSLGRSAAELESHGREQEVSFAYLSRSLALDAAEIERRFREERFAESRFLLGELFENCVGCHSRLPSADSSELGRALFADVEDAELSPNERLRLLVATRQFDQALDDYEALLAGTGPGKPMTPTELELQGVLNGYLRVAIRVKADLPRARDGLALVTDRPDLSSNLRRLLNGWSAALEELGLDVADEDLLTRAREIILQGETLRRFPMDRAGLVHDLVASSLLHRFLAAYPEPSVDAAEACYWLGLTELRQEYSYWLSQAESYLETAIRMAPGTIWAGRAFDALEEEALAGYTGSSGEELPPDVEDWLTELGHLAAGETPSDPPGQ